MKIDWRTAFLGQTKQRLAPAKRKRNGRQSTSNRCRAKIDHLEPRLVLTAPNPFALSTLNGMNGFRLEGIGMNDYSGVALSNAGDINGDGFDDVIIGADSASPGGTYAAGETYVVFGQSGGFTTALSLSSLDGTNGFRLDGIDEDDVSGFAVSGAGDVNGDGFADILIGAYEAVAGGGSAAGESYLVFGKAGPFASAMSLSSLNGSNGFRIDGGSAYDRSGVTLSDAGDVNGDGYSDLIIGANGVDRGANHQAGEAYVVFGKSGGFSSAVDLSTLNGSTGFALAGPESGFNTGSDVSGAGDVNGDGYDDLIVGASGTAADGRANAGVSYVVFGGSSSFAAVVDLGTLSGANGFRLDGVAESDQSGQSVSGAGDVNGDGFDDVIIGAGGSNSQTGAGFVVFGSGSSFSSAADLSSLDGSTGFRLDRIQARRDQFRRAGRGKCLRYW